MTTDRSGAYEFTGLPGGRYSVSATKSGYVSASWGQQQPGDLGKPIDILDGQALERVDIIVWRGAVIAGRILDEFGEPMSGLTVAAVRSMVVNGLRRMIPATSTQTDDLGQFRLFAVAPGQYYLQTIWREFGAGSDADSADRTGYPTTYFPGTVDVASARRFTVSKGDTVDELIMTLSPSKVATVSGSVFGADGEPASDEVLTVLRIADGDTSASTSAIRPDGTFSLKLAAGDYVLRGSNRVSKETATLRITVGTENIKDLRLTAVPPSMIAGLVVVDPESTSSPPSTLLLVAVPTLPVPTNTPARVSEDLTFEIPSAPGRVRLVATNLPSTWMVRRIRLNQADVTDEGIDVRASEDVRGVEVELTNHLSSVSGVANGFAAGDSVRQYSVVIFPSDPEKWRLGSRYLRVVRSDQDGRFRIEGLPAGEYNAIALERVDQVQATDREFLSRLQGSATRFSLFDGERKTISLKLSSGA